MNTLTRLGLCALLFTAPAQADKFHLGTEADAEKYAEGSSPSIEGVLLREENERYVIRTVGGVIELPKSQVWKVESTDLTEDAVAQQEDDLQEKLARDNAKRLAVIDASRESIRQFRTDYAAARFADAQLREASAQFDDFGPAPVVDQGGYYDPVIGVYQSAGLDFQVEQAVRNQLGSRLRRAIQPQIKQIRRELRKTFRRGQ
ncbi:MAG: hypothetical protein AAF196_04335 [Planctomycetota bacterium]